MKQRLRNSVTTKATSIRIAIWTSVAMTMPAVFPITAKAQSNSSNYIVTETALNEEGSQKARSVQFFDGLGRPVMNASNALNTKGLFLHSVTRYDALGRAVETWLPAPAINAPYYIAPAEVKKAAIQSQKGDSVPFLSYEYDALGRIRTSRRPGAQWATKHVVYGHEVNILYDVVFRYVAKENENSIDCEGYYDSGTLNKETTVDEDGKRTTVFSNVHGQKILERRADRNDTYFVYNDNGLLRFVLSPMYQKNASLDKYAYEYRYDTHSRCIYKRIPGCKPTRYWYDNADRVVYMQDGELLSKQMCRFFLYDRFGRPAMQGLCKNTPCNVASAVAEFRNGEGGQSSSGYVTGVNFKNPIIEKICYYDNYECLNTEAFAKCPNIQLMSKENAECATGMATGSIEYTTDRKPLFSVIYYDTKERICDERQSGLDGKLLQTHTAYNFTGKPVHIAYELKNGESVDSLSCLYTYSPTGNGGLTDVEISLNGAMPQKVKKLEYDDWGRITSNTLPGKAGKLMYVYNIRNQLTHISGKGLDQILGYDGLANGSIKSVNTSYSIYPQDEDDGNSSILPFVDTYEYDDLNRLVSSKTFFSRRNRDEATTYDDNGNILSLKRTGQKYEHDYPEEIDNLTYSYNGNQLTKVTDTDGAAVYNNSFDFKPSGNSELYLYDSNGAMTRDPDKGMTIKYDYNGTPKTILFDNGNSISYIYSAGGERLKTIWTTRGDAYRKTTGATVGSYASSAPTTKNSEETFGPFVYIDGRLAKVDFDGGYCSIDSGGNADFHYFIKDYKGSVCIVTDNAGNIEQQNAYYAWGGIYSGMSVNPSMQDRKYSGKPFDRRHGLDLYDYGARRYDPALARWTSPDPLCESYYNVSPYAFCHNNPVCRIDIDGLADYFDSNGYFMKSDNDIKNPYIYIAHGNQITKLSDYNFGKNRRAMMRIVYHYADATGTSKVAATIGVKSTDPNDETLASTDFRKYVHVLINNGYFQEDHSQIYNLRSSLNHEKFHILYPFSKLKYKDENLRFCVEEIEVIMQEMRTTDFRKTTNSFKEGAKNYLYSFLLCLLNNAEETLYHKYKKKALKLLRNNGIM